MTHIRFAGATFAHAGTRPIIKDLCLDVGPGWTALVGPNGVGKSTLLGLISGELRLDRGAICIEPKDAVVLRVEQRTELLTAAVEGFALDHGRAAARIRSQLGLHPEMLERWGSLSAGERRKWQLGALLQSEPDVLLLDEPETHLDRAGRAQLARALRTFRGTGILVAHDRRLIDSVVQRTLWLEDGNLETHGGGYHAAQEARTRAHQRSLERRRLDRERLRRLESELAARREASAATDRAKRASRRMKDKHDHDARSAVARGRVEQAAAAHAQRAGALVERVEIARSRVHDRPTPKALGGSVSFESAPHGGDYVFNVELPKLEVGGRVLLEPCRFMLGRRERVLVSGENGAGKSTLLRHLVRSAKERTGVFHLPQEMGAVEASAALTELRQLPPSQRGRVLTIVAALGLEPERLMRSPAPSPGEAKKLRLALALASETKVLVLDEPETHLDAPSVERLERALASFEGAILLVSHDEAFGEKLAGRRLHLAGGELRPE